jgi:hypothetical protein
MVSGQSANPVCDLLDICQVCNAHEYPNECWYLTKRLTGQQAPPSVEALLSKHPSRDIPPLMKKLGELRTEADSVVRRLRLKNVADSLPSSYIPEVRPVGSDSRVAIQVVSKLGFPIIVVSLEKFYHGIEETGELRQAKKVGLRKFLRYDGLILLTTDVRNRLCDFFLDKPDYFVLTVNALAPDYVTTFDSYTYYDLPTYISEIGICRTLIALESLDQVESKVIGLVLGSNSLQVLNHSRQLIEVGIKLLAYPSYEFRRQRTDEILSLRLSVLRHYLRTPVLALSCSANPSQRVIRADYYSSLSWFPFSASDPVVEGMKRLRRKVINARSVIEQRSLEDFWVEEERRAEIGRREI